MLDDDRQVKRQRSRDGEDVRDKRQKILKSLPNETDNNDEQYLWFVCLFGYVKQIHLTAEQRRQRKRQRSPKTENRTLLAITLFPFRLWTYMNEGSDESLNVAIYKSIHKLKDLSDVNYEDVDKEKSDTEEDKKKNFLRKFDIICMIGPVPGREKALGLVDDIHNYRGERSRMKASQRISTRMGLTFVWNQDRFNATIPRSSLQTIKEKVIDYLKAQSLGVCCECRCNGDNKEFECRGALH